MTPTTIMHLMERKKIVNVMPVHSPTENASSGTIDDRPTVRAHYQWDRAVPIYSRDLFAAKSLSNPEAEESS